MEVKNQIGNFLCDRYDNLKLADISVRTRSIIDNTSTRCHSALRNLLKNTNRSCKRKISDSSHSTQYLRKKVIECEHSFFQKSMISSWAWQHESCMNSTWFESIDFCVWGLGFRGWGDLFWLSSCWCHFCIVVLSQGHIKTTLRSEVKEPATNLASTYFGEFWVYHTRHVAQGFYDTTLLA